MNADELRKRSLAQLPDVGEGRSYYQRGRSLLVSLAFGPHQTILRPAEMESQALIDSLSQAALFGAARIFERTRGTAHEMDRDTLRPWIPTARTDRYAVAGCANPTRYAGHLNRGRKAHHALDLNRAT